MAGPAANILVNFDDPPTWRMLLKPYAVGWRDGGFCYISLNKTDYSDPESVRPFVGSVQRLGVDVPGCEYEHVEIAAIERTANRKFTHSVTLAAMCNQHVDHRLLCSTAGKIAMACNGIVDFDLLDAPIEKLGMSRCEWVGDDPACWTIIGDASACGRWLEHKNFHMVK